MKESGHRNRHPELSRGPGRQLAVAWFGSVRLEKLLVSRWPQNRTNGPIRTGAFGRYGQLSGMVEPVAGLLGVMGVSWVEPSLPYALAFAAGAMVYVVVNDLIPEAASW